MPSSPYAKILMVIDGGAPVSGGQTVAGGNVVQLSGESTTFWTSQLWEIYQYPIGFALPAGWTNVDGVYRSSAVTPPSFTLDTNTNWGKYLFRLTVNNGLLDGVFHGSDDPQPLVDEKSGLSVQSSIGTIDVGWLEGNQFDSIRQYIGELQKTLRVLDANSGGGGGGTPGGSVGQFQWHNTVFAGSPNWVWDPTTSRPWALNGIGWKNGANVLVVSSTPTGARTWTIQDASDTFVGRATTDTLTNKTLDVANNTLTSTGIANDDILFASGGKFVRKAKGANNTFLGINGSGVLGYYTPPGGLAAVANDPSVTGVGVFDNTSGTVALLRGIKAGANTTVVLSGKDIVISASVTTGQVITAPDWYVDPVAGDDSNTGLSSGSALQTMAGLEAKWGYAPRLTPTGGVLTVHLLASAPNSEAAALTWLENLVVGADVAVVVAGTKTTVASGTLTGVSAVDRGYGTAHTWRITDTLVADWTSYVGKRVRITSGPNAGATAFILADIGGNTADISAPSSQSAWDSSGDNTAAFTVADPYVIEDLSTLTIGMLAPNGEVGLGGVSGEFYPTLRFRDLTIVSTGTVTVDGSCDVIFEACRFSVSALVTKVINGNRGSALVGCHFDTDSTLFSGGSDGIYGGVSRGAVGQVSPVAAPNYTYDFTVYGGTLLLAGYAFIHRVGVFNSPQSGLTIESGVIRCKTGGHVLYGDNNAGYGVEIQKPDGHLFWDVNTPTIKGTLGDIGLGGKTTARVWNEGAGRYIDAPIALSWANVNADVSAGGFGLFAKDEQGNASLSRTAEGGGADAGVVPYVMTGVDLDFSPGVETIEHTAAGKTTKLPSTGLFVGMRRRLVCLDEGTGTGAPAGSPAVLDGNGKNIDGSATYSQVVKSEVIDVEYNGTQWRLT